MAQAWYDYLGGQVAETHNLSQNNTIHIMENGVLKDKKGKLLPTEYHLLRSRLGEDIPEWVMRRIDHFVALKASDKQSERIRRAMEAAAAAEREKIRQEELAARRAANNSQDEETPVEAADEDFPEDPDAVFAEEEEEDFSDLEEALQGPTKRKKKKK